MLGVRRPVTRSLLVQAAWRLPFCNARRMCAAAAHLTDHVLPDVPLRQWVLSVPFELRLLLAKNARALSAVGRIFVREIHRWQVERARRQVSPTPTERIQLRGGVICFPQRFGGSLNLNVHYFALSAKWRVFMGSIPRWNVPRYVGPNWLLLGTIQPPSRNFRSARLESHSIAKFYAAPLNRAADRCASD